MKFNVKPIYLSVVLMVAASYAQAAPLAYVPNEKDGTISVIDTSTDKVIKKLPKKGAFGKKIQAVAMHPDGTKLYVVVRDKNAVSIVDLASGKQEKLVKVGDEPEGIDISPAVSYTHLDVYKRQTDAGECGRALQRMQSRQR